MLLYGGMDRIIVSNWALDVISRLDDPSKFLGEIARLTSKFSGVGRLELRGERIRRVAASQFEKNTVRSGGFGISVRNPQPYSDNTIAFDIDILRP
jgi:hypothetical protein